jgi:hypothetical protein
MHLHVRIKEKPEIKRTKILYRFDHSFMSPVPSTFELKLLNTSVPCLQPSEQALTYFLFGNKK